MNSKMISAIVHVLALLAGLCSLLAVALTQPPFSVTPIVAGGFALAATALTYIANGMPALNDTSGTPAVAAPPAPPAA